MVGVARALGARWLAACVRLGACGRGVCMFGVVSLASVATAQTLSLGTPEQPRLGEQASAMVLGAQLRSEADALGAGASADVEVRRAVRLLSAALLEGGERRGRAGASHVLLGRTLAGRVGLIESVVERGVAIASSTPGAPGALDEATLAIVAADLRGLAGRADEGIERLEGGLRVALAPVVDALEAHDREARTGEGTDADLGGWIVVAPVEEAGAYRALVSRLGAEGTPLSGAAVEAMRAIDEVVETASASRPFRRSAGAVRRAVVEAAGALDPMPRWLSPASGSVLASSFERALASVADAARRGQGLDEMRRVGRLVSLIRRADLLEDDQAGRRAREALSNYIAVPPSNRELEGQLLSAFERGLGLALAPGDLPDERLLLRQIRPAWREFQDAARVACGRVADVLPTLLNDSAAMTDPGVLALFNGAGQALAEARGLLHLTWLVAGREDVPAGAEPMPVDKYEALAARLLALSQSASRDGPDGDAARRTLGTLATDATAWRVLPGEAGLRAAVTSGDAAWSAAVEAREHDLLDLIDRTRDAYLANITQDQTLVERAALRARLAMLTDLLDCVEGVAAGLALMGRGSEASEAPGADVSAGAWAGWELSAQAQELASEGLVDGLSQTVSLALRGEDERARIRIAAMRTDLAAGLLPGRLALATGRLGVGRVGGLDEVGLGPPDRAGVWMPASRESLAEFCRAAAELPGIRLRRDDAQDRAVRAYLTMLGQDALAELDAERGRN